MHNRRLALTFLIYCTVHTLVICKTSLADPPPSGNADSSVCSNTLMDRKLLENGGTFSAEDLAIYASDIQPIFKAVKPLPKFYQALKKVMGYNWRFAHTTADFEKIRNCPTKLSHQITDYNKVACQTASTDETPGEVLIDPIWYKTVNCKPGMSNSSAIQARKEKQRDIFVHELLLGITLGTDISADASSEVFRVLTRQPIPSVNRIQSTLESSGFGIYGTSAHSDCLNVDSKPSKSAETLAADSKAVTREMNNVPEDGEKVFGRCDFEVESSGMIDRYGCDALYVKKSGFGTFQCAYDKAVKNCQALYQTCTDEDTGDDAKSHWVRTWPGSDNNGHATCTIEAAVTGKHPRNEAKKAVDDMRDKRLHDVLSDQY